VLYFFIVILRIRCQIPNLDDVQRLVEAQMKNLTDPLETEIQTTTSWWGKIRNRLYITLMQQAVKAIVVDIKQKIA